MNGIDLEQRLYAAFDPAEPATVNDDCLYVKLDDVRGDGNVVDEMARKIRFAKGKPTCHVLAGHRGSGKTTELYRLKNDLERGDPRMFVVFCKADDDIDRNDVDFPDLLVAIVRQLAKQLRERVGITLKPGYFKDRLERLGGLLTREVNFDSFNLETGLGSLGTTLKGSPDARAEIRRLMEPDTGNLLAAANDVISDAVRQIVVRDYNGLVVLVDDLDKMVVRPLDHAGCSSAEHLFVHRAAQLTGFACHVVYSMPISLAYSHQENSIRSSYGGHVPVIPMTKIRTGPPERAPFEPGIEKFRQIIRQRVEFAEVSETVLFADDGVRDHLIALSGGQPFELMALVREAIIAHGLPIGEISLERARREGRREYERQLRVEHWPILNAVRRTGQYNRQAGTDREFRDLLEGRAILQYANHEEPIWYDLNPMVEAIPAPATL